MKRVAVVARLHTTSAIISQNENHGRLEAAQITAAQSETHEERKNLPDTKSKGTGSQRAGGSLSPGDSRTYRQACTDVASETSGALSFFFTSPGLFSHIYPKDTLGGGGLGLARQQVSETKEV